MTEDLRSQTGDCEADARDCQELEAATTLRDVGTVGGGGVTKAQKLRPSTGSWSFSGGCQVGATLQELESGGAARGAAQPLPLPE